MFKFKVGTFSLALLSLSVVCASSPAFAQSEPLAVDTAAIKNSTSLPESSTDKNLTGSAITEPSEVVPNQVAANGDDLLPTDRNVQILKSIDSKYNCGAGALDQTVSRSDFANSVVNCLNALEAKIAKNPGEIPASDLAQLKELTNNFLGEINALNTRVETVEKKVALLQNGSSFSTTTKLAGEVIFGVSGFSGQTRPNAAAPDTNPGSIVATNRVRLNFDTSFTGKDRLRTRLESRNNIPFNGAATINGGTGTNLTRLGWDGDEGNTTNLSLLQYTLPVFNGSKLVIDATGSEFNENMYTFNPLLAPAAIGSFTRFGRFNPVYRQSGLGTAATLDYKMGPSFTASVGYAVPLAPPLGPGSPGVGIANNPNSNAGLFGGNHAAIAQIRYQPSPTLDLGLSYARSYHSTGAGVMAATGSGFANNPFHGAPTSANHYSFSASAKVSPSFVLSGWVGLTNASTENGAPAGTADIFNAAVTAAFPDFGGKGNVLGFVIGIPPRVSSISTGVPTNTGRYNPDTSYHLEALYKIKLSDNISITPGVLLITNPESAPGAASRGSEFVGTIRTTLFF
jgi:Carbohydrate-selective porin, OprB family